MRSTSLAIVFAFCIPFALRAQLSGTYSINSGAGASATNYTTVGAAISDLMTGTRADGGPAQGPGVSAAVTLRIATGTGPYNEQISIGNIPGSSATNFVRLTGGPTRATIQFTGTTTTNRHVIRLDGAKHIRLDSLTITNNDPTYGYGVWLTNAADSNFVTNSLVNVSTTATTSSFAGITISGAAITSSGNFGNFNTITGNVVTGGYYGITCRGTSTTVYGQGNKINDNVIQQVYYYGIYSYYQNLTEILRNTLSYRAAATTSGYAMYIYYNDRFKIERNRLDNLSLYGIYVVYGNIQGGSPTSRARIVNNMVGGSWLGTTPYCIYLSTNCTDIDVFHNSISATSGNGRGIYVTSGSGNALVNNSVSMTNSTTAYAMYVTSAANVSTVNYNNLWAPGSSNFAYIAAAYTPGTFVGGGGFNANSLNLDPNYVSSADLHVGSGTNLFNVGTNVGVTEDFDAQARPLNGGYEIGADEYSPAANDVGPLSMTSPLQPFAPGTLPVSIVLRNYGTSTLTSAVVNWTVNSVPQLAFNFAGSVAPATNSSAQTLGSANFLPGVATNLEFITSMPNGGPDANVVNDTLRVSVCPSLAGTYTIGGGGADFPTINAAVDALVCGGVSAPVTMRLNNSASPFLEQVIIPSIPGASATNTIRFTGGPAMATVLFTGTTTTQRAVIKLDGAKHVTLDSLTITNADGVYGFGVHLTNAADSNAVTNCNVTVNSTATVTNFAGIAIAGNLVADNGNHGNYNTISGNTVTGGYYGISCRGTSASVFCQGNKINGNTVQQTYYYGIYTYYQNLTEINRNDISFRAAATTAAYGIYVYYVDRFTVNRNRLDDLGNYGIYSVYGNYQGGSAVGRSTISNNMVGGSWLASSPYGIYLSTNCTNVDVIHNSVLATSGNGRGIYITSGSGNTVVNNVSAMTGSTTAYGLYVTSLANVTTVNNNDYWVPGSSNFVYIGSAYTPANFVGGGGYNLNSYNVDPMFVGASDLHIGSGAALFNSGANVGATEDFDGDMRPMSGGYDIGADEFLPAANDIGPTSMASPVQPFASGTQPVQLVIRNFGGSTLTSANITWTFNGVPQTPFNFAGAVAPGAFSAPLALGSANFLSGVPNTLVFITSSPNGGADANINNDTLRVDICTALAGTYTVGGVSADFPTINSAVAALECGGVSAAVTMRINSAAGPYNEQVIIHPIAGAMGNNTVRFTGGTGMATVQFTGTNTNERAVIKLDGAKRIFLDSLTVVNNDASFGHGIHLTNNADSNVVTQCNVTVDGASTSSNFVGITIGGPTASTAGNWGDYNEISHNVVNGGYYGVAIRGLSTTAYSTGNKIIGNSLNDSYLYGIYAYSQTSPEVNNNTINVRVSGSTSSYGIYLAYSDGFSCNANTIQGAGGYGIYLLYANYNNGAPGPRAYLQNNMIGGGFRATSPYGIYGSTNCVDIDIIHNSISMDAGNGRCINIVGTTGTTGLDVRNNSFAYTNNSTGYAAYFAAATNLLALDYNNYYCPGSANFLYIGSAVPQATFVGALGFNANSVSGDPFYANPASDLHSYGATLFNTGTNAVFVTTDIDGQNRPMFGNFDIGADEFSVDTLNAKAVSVISPTAFLCPDSNQVVTVVVFNQGFNTISNLPITFNYTGIGTGTLTGVVPGPISFGEYDTLSIGVINTWPGGTLTYELITNLGGDQNLFNDTLDGSVFINTTPNAPISSNATVCTNDSTTLTVPSGIFSHYWYDANIGGNQLAAGDSLHTGALSSTTTYYVEARGFASGSLQTTMAGGNGCSGGAMFDILPYSDIILDSLESNISSTGPITVNIYYRVGTYAGNETNSGAWILHGGFPATALGTGNATKIVISPLSLPSGSTYGIYVEAAATYTNGSPTYSNADLMISTGTGLCSSFGGTNLGRSWNGKLFYTAEGCASQRTAVTATVIPVPANALANTVGCGSVTLTAAPGQTYSWSNSASTQSITTTLPGIYIVTVTDQGCFGVDSAMVTINALPLVNIGADTSICSGQNITLNAGNPGSTYQWSTGGTSQTQAVGSPGIVSVIVTDNNSCVGTDSMNLTVIAQPVSGFSATAGGGDCNIRSPI